MSNSGLASHRKVDGKEGIALAEKFIGFNSPYYLSGVKSEYKKSVGKKLPTKIEKLLR